MHEGMMALTIALIAVVGSFLLIFGIVFIAVRARNHKSQMLHQERMLALEKGLPVPPDYLDRQPRRRPYVRGLVFAALGLGLMIWGWFNAYESGGDHDLTGIGFVFFLVGVALLIGDKLTMKKSNGYDSGSYSAPDVSRPLSESRS